MVERLVLTGSSCDGDRLDQSKVPTALVGSTEMVRSIEKDGKLNLIQRMGNNKGQLRQLKAMMKIVATMPREGGRRFRWLS